VVLAGVVFVPVVSKIELQSACCAAGRQGGGTTLVYFVECLPDFENDRDLFSL
jgi:hypothetical protein